MNNMGQYASIVTVKQFVPHQFLRQVGHDKRSSVKWPNLNKNDDPFLGEYIVRLTFAFGSKLINSAKL